MRHEHLKKTIFERKKNQKHKNETPEWLKNLYSTEQCSQLDDRFICDRAILSSPGMQDSEEQHQLPMAA